MTIRMSLGKLTVVAALAAAATATGMGGAQAGSCSTSSTCEDNALLTSAGSDASATTNSGDADQVGLVHALTAPVLPGGLDQPTNVVAVGQPAH